MKYRGNVPRAHFWGFLIANIPFPDIKKIILATGFSSQPIFLEKHESLKERPKLIYLNKSS